MSCVCLYLDISIQKGIFHWLLYDIKIRSMAWRDVSDGMTVALQPSVTQWPGWQWRLRWRSGTMASVGIPRNGRT